jgi:DNA-binding NarL/FixJ family response regulator
MRTTQTKKLRVLLADDHDLVRRGLRTLIESEPGWLVCGVAETGPQAVDEARRLNPDIVVVDLEMPGYNGLEVTRRIKRHLPNCEVLIFTGSTESDELIRDVFATGAKSFIVKTEAAQFLIDALRSLGDHKPYFTENASAVMFARFTQTQKEQVPNETTTDERLSVSEHLLVRLLSDGHSNASVAKKQRLSIRTIENARAGIMSKLNLASFPDLVRYAARNGIIKV